jgi:hypothetical protein
VSPTVVIVGGERTPLRAVDAATGGVRQPTDEELGIADTEAPHAGVNYFGNTSVMEYQWERFDETVGIGTVAFTFGIGPLVQVFLPRFALPPRNSVYIPRRS